MQAIQRFPQARSRRNERRPLKTWLAAVVGITGELFALASLAAGLMAGLGVLAMVLK